MSKIYTEEEGALEEKLKDISSYLGDDYAVSIVARHVDMEGADIVVSDDVPYRAMSCIEATIPREARGELVLSIDRDDFAGRWEGCDDLDFSDRDEELALIDSLNDHEWQLLAQWTAEYIIDSDSFMHGRDEALERIRRYRVECPTKFSCLNCGYTYKDGEHRHYSYDESVKKCDSCHDAEFDDIEP